MEKNYPKYFKEVQTRMSNLKKELPNPMSGFAQLHQAATAEGALNPKDKELIALGIAITVRCNGCIAFHIHDAIKAGATREEILETIGVAILMGGGPAMIYGTEALEAMNQFEEKGNGRVVANEAMKSSL